MGLRRRPKDQRGKDKKRDRSWHSTYDDGEVAAVYDGWPIPMDPDPSTYTDPSVTPHRRRGKTHRGDALS
jgi:hypothetical protein